MEINQKTAGISYLHFPAVHYTGLADFYAHFIEEKHLLDAATWVKFVKAFAKHWDIEDNGWRSEYWGKMMRGACMTYAYTRSEKLYAVLTEAVEGLLSTQDDLGRISGYDVAHEFCGWDMWGRKYVLTGCFHYYEICRDEALKEKILHAMRRHLDYILSKIGAEEGKIAITDTSEWWGGVNACSILEPVVQLYKYTGEPSYKAFAEYIVSTGGCKAGSLLEAVKNAKKPVEFPVVKAYETMSFFEGLLAYYEVSGKKEYFALVQEFAETVFANEITLIGCAGCTHELFDGAAVRQTESAQDREGTFDELMQETCVTVTWMRLLARIWEQTADGIYMDRIEQSARNALFGSVNTLDQEGWDFWAKEPLPALPFDSYSPLYNNARGRGVGGMKKFPDGGFYGCCACIGAAGTALYPLYAIAPNRDVIYVNFFMNGEAEIATPSGHKGRIVCRTEYPLNGSATIVVHGKQTETFSIAVRIPSWCENAEVVCSGKTITKENGYAVLRGEWQDGDTIALRMPMELKEVRLRDKVAFVYGPIVLARDEAKEEGDITSISPVLKNGKLQYRQAATAQGEQVRLLLTCKNGEVLLTDYASCGKAWRSEKNHITAWMNEV